jgi:hypothetical protein
MFGHDDGKNLRVALTAPDRLAPGHRDALESELMAGFDRRSSESGNTGRQTMKVFTKRRVVVGGFAMAATLGAVAWAAPADLSVPVGRSVKMEMSLATGETMPDPEKIIAVLQGAGHVDDVSLRVAREGEDHVAMQFEVWGTDLGSEPMADRIKAAFPALSGATFTEEALEGTVRGTVGEKLGHDLFDLKIDHLDVEAARKQVMERLKAEGVEGADVQVEKVTTPDGKDGMRVRVEKRIVRDENGEHELPPEDAK